MRAHLAIFLAGLGLASVSLGSAAAGERISGQTATKPVASPEAGSALAGRSFEQRPAPKYEGGSDRALDVTRDKAKQTYALVGRTRDGKEVRREPSDELVRAVLDASTKNGQRSLVGKDNRKRVRNTDEHPWAPIGYLGYEDVAEERHYSCTGTMVGRRVMITSAYCLFYYPGDGQEGRWNDSFVFWPGIDGEKEIPFGSYDYDTAYVFDGWITEYDGNWDSIMPYNIGVIVFQEPVGDSTGWLGSWNFDEEEIGGWSATLADYTYDKEPPYTLWQTTCVLKQETMVDWGFNHTCDVTGDGAPMFVYDKNEDSYYVVGMHIGSSEGGERNLALRLYGPIYEWIDSLDQQ